MNKQARRSDWENIMSVAMLSMALVLFGFQLRSLVVFPQPNSFRMFGDETWLMSEAHSQIATGIARYDLAAGSTLEHSKGLILSMTWLSSLLYGLPTLLVKNDLILVGRMVTAVLSLLLLISIYWSARRLNASRLSASIVILILVSSRAFFFASHCCRPDLLAGLIVLLFVTICTTHSMDGKRQNGVWWFVFGSLVVFFAFSSSIHLLTLLLPVAVFFIWRWDNQPRARWINAAAGGAFLLGILVLIYYGTIGNLLLFGPTTARSQFHDVLSAIPIMRPLSRSVQVANIVIRFKEFVSEAPQVFLLILVLPLMLTKQWRIGRHTFAAASLLVFLSWLLLEGAQVTYLMHIMPLLMLGLALVLTRLFVQEKYRRAIVSLFTVIAILVFSFGIHDAVTANANATALARGNMSAVFNIEKSIAATWSDPGKPRVVTEPLTLAALSKDSDIQTITDHFISFPQRSESLNTFFTREYIDYVVLYNSSVYPHDHRQIDPFYLGVKNTSRLIDTEVGTIGDIGRDYFNGSSWKDTLLLFKVNIAR
ncbi:MAG TPA: hypothetical protein VG537_10490 [Candidatus Kapabacteria bacterium]|jgi:hypothetical protein|nr:hypothetical protein [Candidatus Kapabacteria bacterium]